MSPSSISHAPGSDASVDGGGLPTRTAATSPDEIRLTPVNRRGWSRGTLPFIALFTPIYVTALVIANSHRLMPIVGAIVTTIVVAVALIGAFSSTNIRLQSDGVAYADLLSTTHFVPTADIASAVILKVYDTESLRRTTQLFLLDAEGRTRFRMRGRYWTNEQIEQVAAHFDVPIERIEDPLTRVELRTARRDQLVWYERRPVLGILAVVAVGTIVAIAIVSATILAITGTEPLVVPSL